jgi:peroxiredoxin
MADTENRALELAKRYPDDVIVQRLAQRWILYGGSTADESVKREYRNAYVKRAEEEPNNPVALNLASHSWLTEPEEGLRLNRRAIEIEPGFPWSHLGVSWASFKLVDQLKAEGNTGEGQKERLKALEGDTITHLEEFLRLCPNQSWSVIKTAPRYGGEDFWKPRITGIREDLYSRQEIFQVMMFPRLWNLEFALTDPEIHPELRERLSADLDHIHSFDMPAKYSWWKTLVEGAVLAADTELEKDFTAQIKSRFPCSPQSVKAENEAMGSLRELADTGDIRNRYEKLKHLAQRCPRVFSYANSTLLAVQRLDDVDDSERVAVIEHAVDVFHDNRHRYRMRYSPYFVGAEELIERGLEPERALELAILDSELQAEIEEEEFESLEDAPVGIRAMYSASLHTKRLEDACLVGEARLANGDVEGAKASLLDALEWKDRFEAQRLELDQKLNTWVNKSYARISRLEAAIALAEDRPADAFAFYLTAAGLEDDEGTSRDDALKVWGEMGGSRAAFAALVQADTFSSAEFTAWEEREDPLDDFVFPDLSGKKWRLADLRGKTVLINHWATWCGPCRQELPYVQKLDERFSERDDVLILTWNGDRSPGLVGPFVKKNGYSFPVLFSKDYLEEKQGYTLIPQTVIVDSEGTVRWWQSGFSSEHAETWLEETADMIERMAGAHGG